MIAAGYMSLINGLALGNDANSRIGRIISIRSLEIRYYIETPTAQTGCTDYRFSVVLDRQCNGAALGIAEALEYKGASNLSFSVAPRNMANRKRTKMLYDDIGVLSTIPSYPNTIKKVYLKFRKPIEVTYNSGTDALVGSIQTNSMWILTHSRLTTNAPVIWYFTRFRYTDS